VGQPNDAFLIFARDPHRAQAAAGSARLDQQNKNKTPPTLLSAASKFVEALAAR
jgi:hypothetical protein